MTTPRAEVIARAGHGTDADGPSAGAAAWTEVALLLTRGEGTTWLNVPGRGGGVHTRPLFAAWTGSAFVFATKATAAKTGHLSADGRVSLAIDLTTLHVVVEGTAARLVAPDDLRRASAAMLDVYGWPTEVVGAELDAPYAAPSSGGPPFQVWEVPPSRAYAFPTDDQVEPTRFTFA